MTRDPFATADTSKLDPDFVQRAIRRFLAEDVGSGDVTTERTVPAHKRGSGRIIARQACVVAGVDLAAAVFAELDPALSIERLVQDGARVMPGAGLLAVSGRIAPILTGERLALNLLQRLSGIATVTRRYADALQGTAASVSDTRKTTPGLRAFEKYAVRVGGGRNHRIGLFDAVLIKDNHVVAAGGIAAAVKASHSTVGGGTGLPIQAEIDDASQLPAALDAGVDALLLDNMTPEQVAAAVQTIRAHARGRSCWVEASGGITIHNIRAYAEAGVDTISVGALTHSAPSVDIALDLELASGVA